MKQWKADILADSDTIATKLTENPTESTIDSGDTYVAGFIREGTNTIGYYATTVGEYVLIASFYYKSETIGQKDPYIKQSTNKYVEVRYYWKTEFNWTYEPQEALKMAREQTKNKTPDQKGWMHGYRLKSLKKAVIDLNYPDK